MILIVGRAGVVKPVPCHGMSRAPELQALGTSVRDRRRQLGLSQEALAARTGLHRTYIGGIERGERNVSLLNICVLAEALSTTVSNLVANVRTRAASRERTQ